MRRYQYMATDASIEALRHLKAPWLAVAATDFRIAVTTAEEAVVLLSVEAATVEPALEAMRLRADLLTRDDAALDDAADVAVGDLGQGRNDVVVFAGETWVEEGADGGNGTAPSQTIQFSGRAGHHPASATAVCTTTDAIVVAAGTGEGMLVRIGARPLSVEVVRDRVEIARFLVQRGYGADEDPR